MIEKSEVSVVAGFVAQVAEVLGCESTIDFHNFVTKVRLDNQAFLFRETVSVRKRRVFL